MNLITLTPRETQVASRLCRGLKDEAIRLELGMSKGGVRKVIARLNQKFKTVGRLELAYAVIDHIHGTRIRQLLGGAQVPVAPANNSASIKAVCH